VSEGAPDRSPQAPRRSDASTAAGAGTNGPSDIALSRIRVGGMIEQAKLIFQPSPEYPQLAKMARIQGTVRLEAVIAKDGTIEELKLVSGHPLLVKAAMDAVWHWRYQPTQMNGEAVEVITEVDVNFTLGQ